MEEVIHTSGYIAPVDAPPGAPAETTTFAASDDTMFVADARERIDEALKARSYRPRNRKERRTLMKKMGKNAYNEFMAITDTAAKLDYIDLIEKLRELNKKKENEVIDDEQATED